MEIVVKFGSGKTQLCHQLVVMVQLPEERVGWGRRPYILMENTSRSERIMQIAKARGLYLDKAFRNIFYYAMAYSSDFKVILIESPLYLYNCFINIYKIIL
ncbi:recombinase A [Pyrobaculum sp.]|uniref:RecA/RadA recombinase n=1 Tax=Pyrobaculum oguniense (strain DSM 13380 / JCM 10595 / TE7) TaxID=698757 RepID=H6QBQ6_PYROT|nr:RecA/RadA recombinase [Pyrobaculum oguniense TE7]